LGASAQSQHYRLISENAEYFLRQRLKFPPGIDEAREYHCQALAAKQGLAPMPRYYDANLGIYISDFIPSARTLDTSPLEFPAVIDLISQLHTLPRCTEPLDILSYLHTLQALIPNYKNKKNKKNKKIFDTCCELAKNMAQLTPDLVLCHWDCHPHNILRDNTNRLWLVDFEYSQVADSSFDLASLAYYFKPSAAEFTEWQHRYLDQRPRSARVDWAERLSLAQALLAGIHDLWYSAQDDAQSSPCR
jgi:thiamine kinase-like enzyme